jgi:hypothetical protein
MGTRRQFIRQTFSGAIAASFIKVKSTAPDSSYFADNPYEGINWKKFRQVASTTHVHITDQDKLDKICRNLKLKHIPISNYYPSVPYYPPQSIRKNQFMVRQEFGTIYDRENAKSGRIKNGRFIDEPIEWNKVIMDPEKGWYNQLPPESKKQMPFTEEGPLFSNIPEDIIFSPNSEQHSFTNSSLHACAVGSMFCSGTFDAHDEFLTKTNGYCAGTGQPWQVIFRKILDNMQFADSGGITINHPVWSGLKYEQIVEMLDFDPRVLGIEIYNDLCATGYGDPNRGWGLKFWDQVLSTGRRCLGFFVPDHTVGKGKNILLVPDFNERECLRSYRKGAFYGVVIDTDLQFSNIVLEKNRLTVETNKPATIRIVTDKDRISPRRTGDNAIEYQLPLDADGIPEIIYLRIEAYDEQSGQIYSQPIRFLKGSISVS